MKNEEWRMKDERWSKDVDLNTLNPIEIDRDWDWDNRNDKGHR
jgi:hypothetical protein